MDNDFKNMDSHDVRDAKSNQVLDRPKNRKRKTKAAFSPVKLFHDVYKPTGEILGKGANSSVETFINSFNSKEYAIKILQKETLRSRSKVFNEIEINHVCQGQEDILQLYEYFEEEDRFYLVFDKIFGGTLLDNIKRRGHLTENEASAIVHRIARALDFLHKKGIAHRDLKLDNILCETNDILPIRICDFDLASSVPLFNRNDMSTTPDLLSPVGTADYMAPEVIGVWIGDSVSYDMKCDLWSLGIILYIMLCGYPPFYGHCGSDCGWNRGEMCQDCHDMLFNNIRKGCYGFPSEEWDTVSDSAKDLIKNLLVRDPRQRYSAIQVMNHPWVSCPHVETSQRA
ncbi:hypothetical protein ACJMK2_043650 [Sinanodonta woodiana]|uniref:Protein kinase domain-containing protein n=1 Tax=Sinanodonta woodiana TaxID=1069815 RepID=A0ABD3VXJ8_SINWO